MRNAKAVTLFELVLVLVILAIGAAMAIPKFGKGMENSKMKAVESSVRHLRNSIILYAAEHNGVLPVKLTGLTHDFEELLVTNYLSPADLAFADLSNNGRDISNYSIKTSLLDIDPLPGFGSTSLFYVCGSLNDTFSRYFCINQCTNGPREYKSTDNPPNSNCP